MKYAFGKAQLKNPTPQGISTIIDVTSAVSGALVTWVSSTPLIPQKPSLIIGSLLGLVILISQSLKPFFGREKEQGIINKHKN